MAFWVGFNTRNPLKKCGFIQEKPQRHDFLHAWGCIQEWRCIEMDMVSQNKIFQNGQGFSKITMISKKVKDFFQIQEVKDFIRSSIIRSPTLV